MTTYADLASLKDWLGNIDDNRDDYKLGTSLLAATDAIDNHCHRTFSLDTEPTERFVTPTGDRAGMLFVPDIADVDSISLSLDSEGEGDYATELTGFVADRTTPVRRIRVYESYLAPTDSVRVTALFGWPFVPTPVEQACLILAARYYKRAASPEGITSNIGDFGPMRVTMRDYDVEALLAPYRLLGWA